ncbi:MAG: dockerin type I repeat-containing protein [Candidatus Zixiibacteriota bacterium]|nr:MAG: dockerin type I repeat-containing protein [candidate division Zixibacteria bacterium]
MTRKSLTNNACLLLVAVIITALAASALGSISHDWETRTTDPINQPQGPGARAGQSGPFLDVYPRWISPPTWTKPGEQLTIPGLMRNIGDAPLDVYSITAVEITGGGDWLEVSEHGPLTIPESEQNEHPFEIYLNYNGAITTGPGIYEGYITFHSNSGNHDSWGDMSVQFIVADTVQEPETVDIRTECIRMKFNNAGNIGRAGSSGLGTYNLDFVNSEIDCDTTMNGLGADDNAGIYLYAASPFISRLKGDDTILNYAMYYADWLDEKGFRPLVSPLADSTSYVDYQYGSTGRFVSSDSTIGLECNYFAPRDLDTCKFIVVVEKIYNRTVWPPIDNVYIGNFLDWDIPSDSGVENGSDHDGGRDLQYVYGGEYGPDSIENNDCVLADQRMGGVSYVGGFRVPYISSQDSFPDYRAMWTELLADYAFPTGGFIPGDIFGDFQVRLGMEEWESINPAMEDSLYQDIFQVVVFGQYDLTVGDTLVFCKILATEYDGGLSGLQATIDAAYAWIDGHPEVFSYPEQIIGRCCYGTNPLDPQCAENTVTECVATGSMLTWVPYWNCVDNPCPGDYCCTPFVDAGDADESGDVNILDVGFIINYLYKNGLAPACNDKADANGNNIVNLLDVTYLIDYLYRNGPDPICGMTGE